MTKRCHGVRSAGTFFKRIVLGVNRASEAVGRTVAEMRELIARLEAEEPNHHTYNVSFLGRGVIETSGWVL
ncbi:MAG: hypothetical protein ACOC8H_00420 [bacterium]